MIRNGRAKKATNHNFQDSTSRLLKRRAIKIGFLPVLLILTASLISGQSLRFKDDLGKPLTLKNCPRRIISLAPNVTEILLHLGLEAEIVGLTRFCDFPEKNRKIEIIGGLIDLNLEKIRALRPDLIIGFRGNPKNLIEKMQRDGLPVFVFESGRSFEDLFRLIRRIGELTCRPAQAKELVVRLNWQLESVERKLASIKEEKKAFLTLYGQGSGLWTCGADSFLSHVLERARLKNVASSVRGNFLVYSREKLIEDKPEIILIVCQNQQSFDQARDWFLRQSAFQRIPAVREGRFYFLDENLFSRFAPRLIEAYARLTAEIYPEIFQEKP